MKIIKNYKKIIKGLYADNLYKNSFYLMLSTIVNGLLGFVFLMIATHIYSSQDVGIYSALFSVMSLIILFSMSGGFNNTIMRFIPTISESERSDLIYSSFMIHIFIVAIISLIFVFFVDIFSSKLIFLKDLFYWIYFCFVHYFFSSIRIV